MLADSSVQIPWQDDIVVQVPSSTTDNNEMTIRVPVDSNIPTKCAGMVDHSDSRDYGPLPTYCCLYDKAMGLLQMTLNASDIGVYENKTTVRSNGFLQITGSKLIIEDEPALTNWQVQYCVNKMELNPSTISNNFSYLMTAASYIRAMPQVQYSQDCNYHTVDQFALSCEDKNTGSACSASYST